MKTRLSTLLLFTFFSLKMTAVPVSGPSEFVGHWDGLADEQVAFTLDIVLEDEELEAILNAPSQGLADLSSDSANLSDDHSLQLSFVLPNQIVLLIEGGLEDGTFVGTYEMGEQAGILAMTKKETDK